MGYHIEATEISVRIKTQDEDAAFRAICAFNAECPPTMKRGGTVGEDGKEEKWFSWMRADFSEYADLREVLREMGFSLDAWDGWMVLTGWHGDKRGQEDLLMESIARWVEPGSYVNWIGEDCARWRWEFSDDRLWVRAATTGWATEKSTPTENHMAGIIRAERFARLAAREA